MYVSVFAITKQKYKRIVFKAFDYILWSLSYCEKCIYKLIKQIR